MPPFPFDVDSRAFLIFLGVNIVLGGAASFSAGRAVAKSWSPLWRAPIYAALLAAAMRFLHHALFAEPLISICRYGLDLTVALSFAMAGFSLTRRRQMKRQYGWILSRRD
jgi:hypothetical protein